MGWRDRLRPASFRGIPFFVEGAEGQHGRIVQEHEYPGQAKPAFEDLGRRARQFAIEGYVLGDDYQTQRDRLVAAVEDVEGPGDLVHPYRGTLRVLARGLSTSERAREGRMARLLFTFVEAGELDAPTTVADPVADLVEATGSLFTASGEDYVDAWNPVDEPAILVEAGAASASTFWDYLQELRLSGPIAKVGAWRDELFALTSSTESRLLIPGQFAGDVTDLLASLYDAVGSRSSAIEAFLGFGSIKLPHSFGSSHSSRLADANGAAVGRLFRETAAGLAARASAETTWSSATDALAARDRALAAITDAQENAGDQAFRELSNVARALAEALPLEPGTLPRIESYTLHGTSSALVIAYRLFDDVRRDAEIIARNRISNPLAIAGGQTLEVLSRA